MIYNFHFTGCQLWDFGSDEFGKFMSTIQRSFKIMFGLPYATHRYFYEAVSKSQHASLIIKRRYVSFIKMIQNSKKTAPKYLLDKIKDDVRSVTGSNIRRILLEFNGDNILDVDINKTFVYQPVPENEKWRINMLNDLINLKNGIFEIDFMNGHELSTIINYICND